MKGYFVLFILVMTELGCQASKSKQTVTDQQGGEWEVAIQKSSDGDGVKITLLNVSDTALVVYDPLQQVIKRKEQDQWTRVNIQYCDCRPCPAPPAQRSVAVGASFVLAWDLNEETCQSSKVLKKRATAGNYQAQFYYSTPNSRDRNLLKVDFTVE